MALENQINLYSVDTGNFYTKKERALHNKNAKIRAERKIIAEKIKTLHEKLIEYGYSKKDLGTASKEIIDELSIDIIDGTYNELYEYIEFCRIKRLKTKSADALKNKLLLLLSNKVKAKESINTNKRKDYIQPTRVLNEDTISDKSSNLIIL